VKCNGESTDWQLMRLQQQRPETNMNKQYLTISAKFNFQGCKYVFSFAHLLYRIYCQRL